LAPQAAIPHEARIRTISAAAKRAEPDFFRPTEIPGRSNLCFRGREEAFGAGCLTSVRRQEMFLFRTGSEKLVCLQLNYNSNRIYQEPLFSPTVKKTAVLQAYRAIF
jgi:hypothetical protein